MCLDFSHFCLLCLIYLDSCVLFGVFSLEIWFLSSASLDDSKTLQIETEENPKFPSL